MSHNAIYLHHKVGLTCYILVVGCLQLLHGNLVVYISIPVEKSRQ
jgi:hypothetical protein